MAKGHYIMVKKQEKHWNEWRKPAWQIPLRLHLGPKGRNVVLDKKFGAPLITNDGVTIAKEIEFRVPL